MRGMAMIDNIMKTMVVMIFSHLIILCDIDMELGLGA